MLGLVMAFSFSESLRRLAAVEAPGPNEGCIALPVASQDDSPAEDIAGRSYTLGHPLANELTLWSFDRSPKVVDATLQDIDDQDA
jgi:hypothetical protein